MAAENGPCDLFVIVFCFVCVVRSLPGRSLEVESMYDNHMLGPSELAV